MKEKQTIKCPNCGKIKKLSCFSVHNNRKSGTQAYCKKCFYNKYGYRNPKAKIYQKRWRIKNIEAIAMRAKIVREALKKEVIQRYGGKCECCGEKIMDFLIIDHISGGGGQHRKHINHHTYEWLKKNNYPTGFRVLCRNCNWSSYLNNGICYHKKNENKNKNEKEL